jgi:small subunit ribosomal protein S9
MSSSMKFYLAKKKQHDAFIASERSEFELGKKHLANMMGMDYDEMTQEDVDKAIDYLFPSGLYDPEARPKMKPPEEVNMSFGHN